MRCSAGIGDGRGQRIAETSPPKTTPSASRSRDNFEAWYTGGFGNCAGNVARPEHACRNGSQARPRWPSRRPKGVRHRHRPAVPPDSQPPRWSRCLPPIPGTAPKPLQVREARCDWWTQIVVSRLVPIQAPAHPRAAGCSPHTVGTRVFRRPHRAGGADHGAREATGSPALGRGPGIQTNGARSAMPAAASASAGDPPGS